MTERGYILHKLDPSQEKIYKKHAEVTINLRYLTRMELQFSKPFSSTLLYILYQTKKPC